MLWESRDKKQAERIERFISEFVSNYANVGYYNNLPDRSPATDAVTKLLQFLQWSHTDLAYWSGIAQPQLSKWLNGGITRLGPDELARISWSIAGGLDGVLLSRSQARDDEDKRENDIFYIDPLSRPKASKSPIYLRPACSRLDLLQSVLLRLAGYSGATEYRDMVWRSCFQAGRPRPLRVGYFPWPPLLNSSNEGVVQKIAATVCGLLGLVNLEYIDVRFYLCEEAIRNHYIDIVSPLMMIIPGRLPWLEFSDPIPYLRVGLCGVLAKAHEKDVGIEGQGTEKVLVPDDRVQLVVPPREVVTLAIRGTPMAREPDEYPEDASKYGGHSAYLLKELRNKPRSEEGRVRVVLTNSLNAEQARSKGTELMRVGLQEIRSLKFPLGFACSSEEPRLRRAINQAIRAMTDTGQFDRLLNDDKMKKELEDGGIEYER